MTRALATLAAVLIAAAPTLAQDKIKVLIVDGQNNHNYKAMTPFMKEQLEKSGRYAVDVSTSPAGASKAPKDETPEQKAAREKAAAEPWAKWRPAFKEYKVVISNYNGQMWPDDVRADFEAFVRDGGGFLCIHAANNSFPAWVEYNKMIGLGWRDNKFGPRWYLDDAEKAVVEPVGQGKGAGHGQQHEFAIAVRVSDHPLTQSLPKLWMHAQDELYHGQRGPTENMKVLMTAFDDKAKGGTGVHEPMLWVIPYGKGQVVVNVMGHENGKALQCRGFLTLLDRSCEWLATGKVTTPVPADFPTSEKTSVVGK